MDYSNLIQWTRHKSRNCYDVQQIGDGESQDNLGGDNRTLKITTLSFSDPNIYYQEESDK